jgi:hypothetical protein
VTRQVNENARSPADLREAGKVGMAVDAGSEAAVLSVAPGG